VSQLPRSARPLGLILGSAALIAIATAAAGSVLSLRVARAVVTPSRRHRYDQVILHINTDAAEVTLQDTPDAGVAGRYGVWFDGDAGFMRVGDVLRRAPGTVTRRIEEIVFGDVTRARRARMGGFYYLEPEELGYPVSSAPITTSLGQAPAWVIPADNDEGRWVIQIHGRGAERHEALRAVPVFRDQGYTSLVLSYRNDGDAPDSEDRRYGLGGTEWLDVEAGIRYALDNGAESIILMGWSMGGAIALQTISRSPSLERVRGLVLESPVIDWIDTLEFQGELYRLPSTVTQGAIRALGSGRASGIIGHRTAIDLKSMDFVERSSELSLPMLILHSDDDGFVPATSSRALAASRPDIVTLVSFSEARHTKLWNYDEARWTGAIAGWLDKLDARV
jgi:uncharacterized protein